MDVMHQVIPISDDLKGRIAALEASIKEAENMAIRFQMIVDTMKRQADALKGNAPKPIQKRDYKEICRTWGRKSA